MEILEEFDKEFEEYDRDPTLTPEQLEIVEDMEENGEMDVLPSELGQIRNGGTWERIQDPITIDMPYTSEYDIEEFIEQAQLQEEALNDMTVQEFLENADARKNNGRSKEGSREQEQYKDGLFVCLMDEWTESDEGLSIEEAEKLAQEELKGNASLHNPDQIAGGNPLFINALGDSKVNSAIGSLWGHGRTDELYQKVLEASSEMSEEEKESTYLDVTIHTHPKT